MTNAEQEALRIVKEISWYVVLNAADLGWLKSGLTNEQIARAVYVGTKQGLESLSK